MFLKFWKLGLVALLVQCAFLSPAHACRGAMFDSTYFLSSTPEIGAEGEFAGVVILQQKRKWFFFKPDTDKDFRAEILASPTHPHLIGRKLEVEHIVYTSCEPWVKNNDAGIVTGTLNTSDDGSLRLRLVSYSFVANWKRLPAAPSPAPEQP